MTEAELLDLVGLGEGLDVEFKTAEGGFPKDAWCSISAFANTEGGTLVLGVKQKGDDFELKGINNPEAMQKNFWNSHNNPQKLNAPVCNDADISLLKINGSNILAIYVPRAGRTQRPVFINGNPLTGTYKRNYEGDYCCTEPEVRQMLRDAGEDPQDAVILEDFDLTDLDPETLKAFRNRFASREPDHPFLAIDDTRLLERLGGWRRDRRTGNDGLTLAGLLMFGRERSILDAFPNYHLDYQEKFSKDPEERWTFRLTIDGKGEPNLFNFYFKVYPRLVENLNVPFKLDKGSIRLSETHVHEGLREALANSLIHADHHSSRAITIIKQPDVFVFINPGRLRIPRNVLYQGGVTDPRNPNLQKMFQMLGLGEKAGSGFQKILRAWREQHWIMPLVSEDSGLEMTRVWLPLASMILEMAEDALRAVVGESYPSLSELDRIILMLSHRFGEISNSDIQPYRREHPKEIGDRLKFLVYQGWLDKTGSAGRGTRYSLPSKSEPRTLPHFNHLGPQQESSEHYTSDSEHYTSDSEHYEKLLNIAKPVREKRRVNKEIVRNTILQLCAEDFLTLRTLADLLKRDSDSIRNHYLRSMLKEGLLTLQFPDSPNHPQQRYKALNSK